MYNYPKHIKNKIISVNELLKKLSRIRKNKRVALCHGTFDIVHPGHIRHLTYAKLKSDILIASVTSDKYVTKKKEGAYVPERLRSLNLASLEIIDFVIIDNNLEPLSILSNIKPDYFVKGFEYSKNNIHPKTKEEIKILKKFKGKILFSPGDVIYSSTKIQNINKPNLSMDRLHAIMESEKVSFNQLRKTVKNFSRVKIHLIGDIIIDKYNYCSILGQTTKTPTFSIKKNLEKTFVGGAGVVAKHIKNLGSKVIISSMIGKDSSGKYLEKDLKNNDIKSNLIVDETRNTTVKERFWGDDYKLLQVDLVDNHPISEAVENKFIKHIKSTKSDGIIFSDFRHGIFNPVSIRKFTQNINKKVIKIADSQVSNRWGNILDFKNFVLILPTEQEARFSLADQDSGVRQLGTKLYLESKAKYLIMKLGEKGIISFRDEAVNPRDFFPIDSFVKNLEDGLGAGDALLAASSLALIVSKNIIVSSILGNCAAALACEKKGNDPISQKELLSKIDSIEKEIK